MYTGTRLTTAIHRRLLSRFFLREGGRLYTGYSTATFTITATTTTIIFFLSTINTIKLLSLLLNSVVFRPQLWINVLELPSASDWFQICRFPDDPDFRISGFPYFRVWTFPVYVSTCIWPCRAGWIEGLFEVVALKSQFSDPKWDLPSWFSDSRANFHLWTVVLPSYLAQNVPQFHLFWA